MLGTRGNSELYDGVFWLEQVRTIEAEPVFRPARAIDSQHLALPKFALSEKRTEKGAKKRADNEPKHK